MTLLSSDDLNPAQREAVLTGDGPTLIIAGAGSGKTRVLSYRIAYLTLERKLAPDQLLAVTFTNKAAGEMRERVASLLGAPSKQLWIGTFHSICARLLRKEIGALSYGNNFTIFDEREALTVLRHIVADANLAGMPTAEMAHAVIDRAKNEGLWPEQVAERAANTGQKAAAEIYRLYQERMRALNAVDFSDLLLLTARLFEREPAVLSRWQQRFSHLLVDEYQDTNRVQYLLVRTLSALSGNLYVVGDEDQSIYRWRGADIRNILDFERDFPNARVLKLEQNYRSTKTILAAADTVISHNSERKTKRLWTDNPSGEPVTLYTGKTERDEADFIAREIEKLCSDRSLRLSDFVVFYRTNAQSRVIEEALARRRIPYCLIGGTRFYDRTEIRDLLAYLKFIANPADVVSLQRLIGAPPRGIGDRTLETLATVAARESIGMFEALGRAEVESTIALARAKQASALYLWLRDLMGRADTMTVRAIVDEVVIHTDFGHYLDGLPDSEARRENLAELASAAAAFDTEYGSGGLGEFLERATLITDADQTKDAEDRATLMTLHTSKGLEYPVVFIAGMEEGLFPHSRMQEDPAEIEEERRLCYVGMTRAQRLLYLTNTLSREIYGRRQESRTSRFLAEIDTSLVHRVGTSDAMPLAHGPSSGAYIDYSDNQLSETEESPDYLAVGRRVTHPTFGHGVIRRREGRGDSAKALVDFGQRGIKLLMLKFANLRTIAH